MKQANNSKLMEIDKSLLCETDKQNITIVNNMIDFLFSSTILPLSIKMVTKLKKFSTHLFIIIKGRYKYTTQSYKYGNC